MSLTPPLALHVLVPTLAGFEGKVVDLVHWGCQMGMGLCVAWRLYYHDYTKFTITTSNYTLTTMGHHDIKGR